MATTITDTQRYDRQIRVWGAEAQSRIQNARILVCGLAGLHVEVVKNLVLAGMSVTLVDSRVVSLVDFFSNFFVAEEDVGKKIVDVVKAKAHELNPNVKIETHDMVISEINAEIVHKHDVVLLHGESEQTALRINALCREREAAVKFFWSDSFGDEALFFADFGAQFTYRKDKSTTNNAGQNGSSSAAPVTLQTISFPSLQQTLSKPWKDIPSRLVELSPIYLRFCATARFRQEHGRNPTEQDEIEFTKTLTALLQHNGVENLSPTLSASVPRYLSVAEAGLIFNASILGSFLSQEVIKAISLVGEPGMNVFVYNGQTQSVMTMPIK